MNLSAAGGRSGRPGRSVRSGHVDAARPADADPAGPALALVAAAGAGGVSAVACLAPAGGVDLPRVTLLAWVLSLAAGAVLARRGGRGWRGGEPRPGVAAALLVLGTALLCSGAGGVAVGAVVALCGCGAAAAFAAVRGVYAASAAVGLPSAALAVASLATGGLAAACWLPQARGAVGAFACAAGLLCLARTVRTSPPVG
ncbi:hypothetical protein ABT039_12850 [Streptomyces lasiicapitis]|uniref:hypothetical protein n=1 Tax=Streptomyces lasiicapitis TaxID=1923961 RepID=UPI00331F06C5